MAKHRKTQFKVPTRGDASAAVPSGGAAIPVRSVDAFDGYVNGDLPVVIDFWAPWCGPCKVMAPIFERVAREFEGRARFLKVDTEQLPQLAQAFGIRSIPTLVVLDHGEVVDSNIGVSDDARLARMVQRVIEQGDRVGLMTRVKRWFGKAEKQAG